MRRFVAVVVTATALLAVSCSSVPTDGKATVVDKAPTARPGDDAERVGIRRSGTRRSADDSPVQVVTGFLDAEADTTQEGSALAKDYLVRGPKQIWYPDADTLVYTAKDVEEVPSTDAALRVVRVTYSLLARITTDPKTGIGEYRPDVRKVEQTIEVRRPDGEWLIGALPHGRRINVSDLDQVFRRVVPYHYADSDYRFLVPDPLFLLKHTSNQIQRVLKQLVAGPSPVLADFLPPSRFPVNTSVLTVSEPKDKIVEVTFSPELEATKFADRPKIIAQIVWTLTSLDTGINAVRIKAADKPFEYDLAASPELADVAHTQADWEEYDPDDAYERRTSYFNQEGAVGSYGPASALRAGPALGADAGEPAIDWDNKFVAVTAPAKLLQELRVGPLNSGALLPQVASESLTKPSWGTPVDGVWVVSQGKGEPPKLVTVPAELGNNQQHASTELGSRVHAFEVAPDGLRVAAVIERDGESSLEVGYIDRPLFDGKATRVGGFRKVVNGRTITASSVVWLDSGKLGFIGRRAEETAQVFTVLVDGTDLRTAGESREVLRSNSALPVLQPQLLPLAVRHESARRGDNNGPENMMLVIEGRTIYTNRGAGWVRQPAQARAP